MILAPPRNETPCEMFDLMGLLAAQPRELRWRTRLSSVSPTFRIASTFDDLIEVMSVRSIVFIHEQNCPYSIEVDGQDWAAVHILGEKEGEPVAAGRMRFLYPYAKLERLAVRQQYRGLGYGHQLLAFMMATARDRGFEQMKLHAQVQATEFYRKQGFQTRGEVFVEADIDHLLMVYEPNALVEDRVNG